MGVHYTTDLGDCIIYVYNNLYTLNPLYPGKRPETIQLE